MSSKHGFIPETYDAHHCLRMHVFQNCNDGSSDGKSATGFVMIQLGEWRVWWSRVAFVFGLWKGLLRSWEWRCRPVQDPGGRE